MSRVMPSQAVAVIDQLFPYTAQNPPPSDVTIAAGHSTMLQGIMSLVREIPPELIVVPPNLYADFVLGVSTIETQLKIWISRGEVGTMPTVKGRGDAVTVIRRVLEQCPDDYPAPTTTELLFITDDDLRDSIRRDVGAAYRALNNVEWKAATVLAGASIEALLHWRLQQPKPTPAEIQTAITALTSSGKLDKPPSDMDKWSLHHFIEVAGHLSLIEADTVKAAQLAQNFRNLIHPGRAARLGQVCDRGTAYSAIGALEHVIRNLS